MVTHANVVPFIRYMVDRYQITPQDRLSQMFDMTFDLSVFDMFVAWSAGACVCCPSQKTLIKPGKFIQDAELTLWFSVPSTAVFMKRLGMLKPGKYPNLRWSLFCGEPLPVGSASAWLEAAPNSILENLYGPTELTIACTLYRWDPARSPAECEVGVVPIGEPYPDMRVLVVDENLQEVPAGSVGELLMNGPQMTSGYWRDPEKTAAAFVVPPGRTEVFYRTGDRVRKQAGTRPMTHLGRVDFQVKVHGHRVELFEVEAIARQATGLDGAVAIGWPRNESGYGGIALFIEGETNEEKLRKTLESRLPDYMVPGRIRCVPKLPVNVNGKFDRNALTAMLEDDQVS
jgi:non-ribosomal peptide synthetase component F